MLQVHYCTTSGNQRWAVRGILAGSCLHELRACWEQTQKRTPVARTVVDLSDVTYIGEDAEPLLDEMINAGAEFIGFTESSGLVQLLTAA
jgi:hypothetical protein